VLYQIGKIKNNKLLFIVFYFSSISIQSNISNIDSFVTSSLSSTESRLSLPDIYSSHFLSRKLSYLSDSIYQYILSYLVDQTKSVLSLGVNSDISIHSLFKSFISGEFEDLFSKVHNHFLIAGSIEEYSSLYIFFCNNLFSTGSSDSLKFFTSLNSDNT